MTSILIAVIVAVAVALTIHSARRALAERDAVERHHRTLDVLGTLAERADGAAPGVTPPATYLPRHRRSRPARRWGSPVAAALIAAVLVAVGAGWYLASRHSGTTSQTQAPPKHATTTKPAAGAGPAPASTSTIPAGGPSVVLVSNDNLAAHYRLQRPSADVELVATASCWVEIKSRLGQGPVMFSGTLRPGGRRAVPTAASTGGVSVRLGNPAGMSLSVDGTVLPVPRPAGTKPFTLLFQPAA
jgi:hypothetical protein